jgi:hypothetical protein
MAYSPHSTCDSSLDDIFRIRKSLLGRSSLQAAAEKAATADTYNPSTADHRNPAAEGIFGIILNRFNLAKLTDPQLPLSSFASSYRVPRFFWHPSS